MISEEIYHAIKALSRDVSEQVIHDFLTRMDNDYFSTFSPQEISNHIRMSSKLDTQHRVDVRITRRSTTAGDEFDIVIVGFDYLSEFSIFCGLLSAFGLDIREGDIYSFTRSSDSRALPRKIVDVFSVILKAGETFDEAKQSEFKQDLETLADLLASGSIDEARERLNRFLTERIENMEEALSGLLSPIEIRFDNQVSPTWTVMETRSQDAFGFLYAVSNALAMQGIYINKVKIRSIGEDVRDEFFISDRWGRKIVDQREHERLRLVVAMIKQFTRFLPKAPDPAKAMRHFDQFLGKVAEADAPDRVIAFLAAEEGMNLLAQLLGSSDFLWDDFLGIHFTDLVPVLQNLSKMPLQTGALYRASLRRELRARLDVAASFDGKKRALNRFKDDQLFLIDAKHLLDERVTLTDFSNALTDLAEVVLHEGVQICREQIPNPAPGALTICGLGKFGGREMGYASDLELIFVHEAHAAADNVYFESLARGVVHLIEARNTGIFHIDLRLRPYGDAGAWSIPFTEFVNYYNANGKAAPFERQALTKLRWVAGDETLGRRVEAHRDSFTYSGDPWDSENAMHLRQRQMRELVKPGQINVKYSAGGLIDIEYLVQYLQLLYGRVHPELRIPNTLDALDQLMRLQIVSESEHASLHHAYLFLRNVIDALRIVRGDASDLVLAEKSSEEFKSFARRLGYLQRDRKEAAALLAADLKERMKQVSAEFSARFNVPYPR